MRFLSLALVAAVSLLMVGCSSATSYMDRPLPATPKSQELDVVSLQDIGRKYVLIGVVQGVGIGDLKDAARKLGADAISTPMNRGYYYESQAIKYK